MLFIKELLPNPSGDESQGETISLINQSDQAIYPAGWTISDESGKTFNLINIGEIGPGETVTIKRTLTDIALNNNGDTLYLKNQNGEVIDQLSYQGSILEDEVVIADQFAPEAPPRENNLQANTLESGILDQTFAIQALIVGISIALVAAFTSWILINKENEK